MSSLLKKIEANQTIEKGGLIAAGALLVSVGVAQLQVDQFVGIGIIVLGVICLIAREVLKLRK